MVLARRKTSSRHVRPAKSRRGWPKRSTKQTKLIALKRFIGNNYQVSHSDRCRQMITFGVQKKLYVRGTQLLCTAANDGIPSRPGLHTEYARKFFFFSPQTHTPEKFDRWEGLSSRAILTKKSSLALWLIAFFSCECVYQGSGSNSRLASGL